MSRISALAFEQEVPIWNSVFIASHLTCLRKVCALNSRTNNTVSRRTFLGTGAGIASGTLFKLPMAMAQGPAQYQLLAAPSATYLNGDDNAATPVLAYNNKVSGPILRLKQGEPARIAVANGLNQETTVHWHGIRIPNAMDGVPGLTQSPIMAGDNFVYEFTPPDAGTFWYHPHVHSLEQIGRGLAGCLIVEEREAIAVDRDLVWVLQDWRLNDDGQIADGFGRMMDAAMSGRVGSLVTINGAKPVDLNVRAGERIRLRLINAALARIVALKIEGHRPIIIAVDGQPCEPHEPENGRIVLGPAMRIDVMLDLQGDPGRSYSIIDDYYEGLSYALTSLSYDHQLPLRPHPPDAPVALPLNQLPQPDLANAVTQEITLQGGMMGGGKLKGVGGMNGMAMPGMNGGPVWTINGMSMSGDGEVNMAPLFTLQRGMTCRITLRNETAWSHTMHIHGFSMLVLTRNSAPVPYRQWQDTILMNPKDKVEAAFVADNPGNWMLHCHITDHQMTGLMTIFKVT